MLLIVENHSEAHYIYEIISTQEYVEERLNDLHVVIIIQVDQIKRLVKIWNRKRLRNISDHDAAKM